MKKSQIINDFLSEEERDRLDQLEELIEETDSESQLVEYELEALEILRKGYMKAKEFLTTNN